MAKKKSPPTKPAFPEPKPVLADSVSAKTAPAAVQSAPFFENFWLPAAVLVAATVAVYFNSLSNSFMIFDDDKAIRYNELIKHPTLRGIFLGNNLGMYAPVTWLGYSLVYGLAGENATAFHLFSLLLHAGSVLAVFHLLRMLQPSAAVAFFAALLFAVHPMQVEATCWIAGQSALTFSFFYLLGLVAYVHYLKGGRPRFFGLTLLAFVLSVLSKSAAVTFPLMLLALDWHQNGQIRLKNILAKWPFFAASLVFGLYTFSTREAEGHDLVVAGKGLNLFDRFLMVCHSLLFYPAKMLAPLNLSIFYPMEKTGGRWSFDYFLAPLAVGALVWLAWKYGKRLRDLGLGALWYFLPLTVMLPYVSVGTFEMRSDRYIYISSAGFFFLLVWAAYRFAGTGAKKALPLVFGAAAAVFGFLTVQHSRVWKNEVAAFQNCISIYPESALCNCNLAYGELLNFDFENCVKHYTKTLALDPTYVESHNGRGQAYFELKKFPEAFADFDKAIKAGIVTPKLFLNRGRCHVILNRPAEAIPDLKKSIELEPRNAETYYFKAIAENKTGNLDAALSDYSKAIELRPGYIEPLVNRGLLHFNAGRFAVAISDYSAALAANPSIPLALNNRAAAYLQTGDFAKALEDANKAVAEQPNFLKAYETRAKILTALGQTDRAQADLARVAQLSPGAQK